MNNQEAKHEDDEEVEEIEEEIAVCACMLPPYSSVDPAPPHPKHEALSTHEIGTILRDVNAPLFERFRAMFSLRNRGGEDCVKELGKALGEREVSIICRLFVFAVYSSNITYASFPFSLLGPIYPMACEVTDESSALLRHEVAYVLGQMQHPHAVEYLACSLERTNEHRMVRHESAEALGAIEERWGECECILQKFLDDEDDVVRESCVVALDAADYWGYNNLIDNDDGDDFENNGANELESVVAINENGKEVDRNVNFSIHKAQSNGKTTTNLRPEGVLHNHFNIAKP